MDKEYSNKRNSIRDKKLKSKVLKQNKIRIKSWKALIKNSSFSVLNSNLVDLKDKVCNDERTEICEDYEPLEAGQQTLFNYESNQNGEADEFFFSMPVDQLTSDDDCDICLEKLKNGNAVSKLTRCVHVFHTDCIRAACNVVQRCPICRVCGPNLEGNCPPGRMTWKVDDDFDEKLAGYENCKVIQITYEMNGGYQDGRHSNPGVWYDGAIWDAYLPDNSEGNRVLELFKKAWKMKKTFTVGRSLFHNEDNRITWNDIHHKTDPVPNEPFGYPDPTYLTRVVEDMKAMGIC